jgi:hypothetical protein
MKRSLMAAALTLLAAHAGVALADQFMPVTGNDVGAGESYWTDPIQRGSGDTAVAEILVNFATPQPNRDKGRPPFRSAIELLQLDCHLHLASLRYVSGFAEPGGKGQAVMYGEVPPAMKLPPPGSVVDMVVKYHCGK